MERFFPTNSVMHALECAKKMKFSEGYYQHYQSEVSGLSPTEVKINNILKLTEFVCFSNLHNNL